MKISVIIPTLNEAGEIRQILLGLRHQDPTCEVIVVDGGSRDGTCEEARSAGARVFSSPPGRGQQLAFGAAHASGDIQLFLHADTLLPSGGLQAIRNCLKDPEILGGNFRVVFDGKTGFAQWLTGFYAWFRGHGLYYGDSAIFVRHSTYKALGGIKPIALMEDYDFSRRLEAAGKTVCIDSPAVETSSRRFEGRRPIAIVAGWVLIHALFHLRVPPGLLARLYNSARRRPGPDHVLTEPRSGSVKTCESVQHHEVRADSPERRIAGCDSV